MHVVLIVAAGESRRMGFDKLFAPIFGVPVLTHTLERFHQCETVSDIYVVGNAHTAEELRDAQEAGDFPKLRGILTGGNERYLSVKQGLDALPEEACLVAVHDGARPLITPEQITRCFEVAARTGAAASAHLVTETLKRAEFAMDEKTGELGIVVHESVDRENLWIMETPQVFHPLILKKAYEEVMKDGNHVTDEVSALQLIGVPVALVENKTPNIKITVPADLIMAEALMNLIENAKM